MPDNKVPDAKATPAKKTPTDVAKEDFRARGAELKMSDRDAGSSHLAAQNQVPQEGALVTDPPQPEPPHDERHDVQDHSDDKSRTVEYPKDRRLGHGVSE